MVKMRRSNRPLVYTLLYIYRHKESKGGDQAVITAAANRHLADVK